MGDVIDIEARRKGKEPSELGAWFFSVRVYLSAEPGGLYTGALTAWNEAHDGLEVRDRMLLFAGALDDVAAQLRRQAEELV